MHRFTAIFLNLSMPLFLNSISGKAQVNVSGIVYEQGSSKTMQGVSVLTAKGHPAMTDSGGHYSILVPPGDSIWFSWLGRRSGKTAVGDIFNPQDFDISLDPGIQTLRTVAVLGSNGNNFTSDSSRNRKEYQKVFEYDDSAHSALDDVSAKGKRGASLGLDFNLDQIADPAANKRTAAFHDRLVWEEQQDYINHRFNKSLVHRITGLESPALDSFMVRFRPDYDTLHSFGSDWDYYSSIKDNCKEFLETWEKEQAARKKE